ncbi:MAG: hypothetical protein ACT443_11130 [Gemmatimonadota bacterium]
MHTEHLQRVRFKVVAAGWLVAVAFASLISFVIFALDIVGDESALAVRIEIAAIAIGFFAGGLFAGLRAGEAPILHGVAIGLLSLLAWFVLNLLATVALPTSDWTALTPRFTASVMLVQIIAAIVGARAGYRRVVRRRG